MRLIAWRQCHGIKIASRHVDHAVVISEQRTVVASAQLQALRSVVPHDVDLLRCLIQDVGQEPPVVAEMSLTVQAATVLLLVAIAHFHVPGPIERLL